MNKHLITLEFDKVLKMLSERCASFEAVENALNVVPEKTYEAAKNTLLNTQLSGGYGGQKTAISQSVKKLVF